jgi:hypothetical protein
MSLSVYRAKKVSDKLIGYPGTENAEAYKKICDATGLFRKAFLEKDLTAKAGILEHSRESILEAIESDPDYIEAYYFLAVSQFNSYLINCLGNKENEARLSKDEFMKTYENADEKIIMAGLKENYLITYKKEISNRNFNCSSWLAYLGNGTSSEKDQQARLSDFLSYIENGETPELLKNTLGGPSVANAKPSAGVNVKKVPSSTFLRIGKFERYSPVRFSVVWPEKFDKYTKNIGLSLGNAGRPNSSHHFYFRNQVSFELLQDIGSDVSFRNIMMLSYNLGIQAKVFKMARFNPKPFLTIGYNPALNQIKNGTVLTNKWYLTNGAYNMGVDLDIWITNYMGLSLSFEYTSTLSNVVETLYDKEKSLYMKYSKLKVGLIF